MKRVPIESSDLVSIGYDPATSILEVEFQGGRVYQYRDVEPDIHAQFMKADSFGTFFFAHINGHYRYQKLQTGDAGDAPKGLAFVAGTPQELHDLQVACKPYEIAVEPLELPVEEIQSDNPEDIVIKKAKQAYRLAGQPVVVSTSFWNIPSLHGFPGAYMAAASRWLTPQDLSAMLADKSDRSICRTHTAAFYDGQRHKVFTQDYWGRIAETPPDTAANDAAGLERLIIMNDAAQDEVWKAFAKWLRLYQRLRR